MYIYVHTYIHTYIHMYMCLYIYIYIYTCIYVYTNANEKPAHDREVEDGAQRPGPGLALIRIFVQQISRAVVSTHMKPTTLCC